MRSPGPGAHESWFCRSTRNTASRPPPRPTTPSSPRCGVGRRPRRSAPSAATTTTRRISRLSNPWSGPSGKKTAQPSACSCPSTASRSAMPTPATPTRAVRGDRPRPGCPARARARPLAHGLPITLRSANPGCGRRSTIVSRRWAGRGISGVDVICPGFAADCLETLEEVAITGRERFEAAGGRGFRYIPALNDRWEHVTALTEIVIDHAGDWLE